MYKYLILLIIFAVIPGIYFFLRFSKKRKQILATTLVLFFILTAWEFIALKYKLWEWNDSDLIGRFFGLPIDEYLYLVFVPLMGLGLYEFAGEFIKNEKRT